MPVLVAPAAIAGLRAPVVAAAIGRGLERAGVAPPDLCPVAGGGRGTSEVLLPALGGETGDGFALIEDGGTAIVELGPDGRATGGRIARALDAGAQVVLVAAGASGETGGGAGGVEAIEQGGGLRGAALVVLCETRAAWTGRADALRRDPRGVAMTAAGGGLAGVLWARYDAQLVAGPAFVLEQLGFDTRMRAARAVVAGETRLDRGTLAGRVAGEVAIRARQAGVPCHAVAACNALSAFDVRILDLQAIVEGATIAELEAAGERLAQYL
ncbi:MAG TPA: glycerate kinase [Solirubrobacteraceae bacterium]|nr:glycerate kinase [Solirubrobacteraceae bacterium]